MEEEDTIVEEKEVLMIPPCNGGLSTLRKAHFLKPIFNPNNQPLLKLDSFSFCSKPTNIKEKIVFKGMLNPQKSWKMWVKNLQKTHQNTWKKVRVFDAIRASTYNIKKHSELIIGLAEKWSPQTNTFIFPWGEATITLEDVLILGGFSALGVCVKNLPKHVEIQKKLNDSCSKIKKQTNTCNVNHYSWMNYFRGIGGELEHVAFIALWLSRYVFSSSNVFSIAINLVRGTQIALAPAVLASIYRDLRLLNEKIVGLNSEEGDANDLNLFVWAPLQLVQVWAWERFPGLSPIPVPLVQGEPRLARWRGLSSTPKIRDLRVEIESARDEFLWRPYALCVKNWDFPKFYCDQELWVLITSEIGDELLSFVRCLRVSELVGMNCIEQYLPYRVAMQFGFDQDIPFSIPRLNNSDVNLAWSSYDKPVDGLRLYLSPRLFEGDVTVQYSDWWRSHKLQPVVVGEVWRKGVKKVKRLSKILNETMEFSVQNSEDLLCYENSENMQDVVINLLLGLEDCNEKGESIANTKEEEEKEVNKSSSNIENTCSQIEAPLGLVGSSHIMLNEKSFSCKGFEPRNHENEAKEIEENLEHNASKVVNDNNENMGEGGKYCDEGVLSEERPLINIEMNPIFGFGVEDAEHKYEDEDAKRIKTSIEDVVVIGEEEEEENVELKQFEALCLDFETRIDKLEKIVYTTKRS